MDLSARLSTYLAPDSVSKKRDLENSWLLLRALGDPHKRLPPAFHVAGTNGKGSTVAMLKSIFQTAGYVVHRYTSPHLVSYNERIELGGTPISDALLERALERVETAVETLRMHPSFFEVLTAAAMLVFSEHKADVLLLETGLGGRLDCTNVVEQPLVTVITSISKDHTEYLGHTLTEIAYEKAGIIKPYVPCIISRQTPDVYHVLLEQCRSVQARAVCCDTDFWYKSEAEGMVYHATHCPPLRCPTLGLAGHHQLMNAAGAVAAVQAQHVLPVCPAHIVEGVRAVEWPGRLQKMNHRAAKQLLGTEVDVYVDGAHNDAAAACLNRWIETSLPERPYLVLGMKRTKNPASFCKRLSAVAPWGVAVPVSGSAGYDVLELAEKASQGRIHFTAAESLLQGLQSVVQKRGHSSSAIIVTGSLHLVGAFLELEQTASQTL